VRGKLDTCANCGVGTPGAFCPQCGQKAVHYHASVWELIEELFGELLQLDSRIGRTIVPFLFRPGQLTAEFNAGRRLTYSSPLRLYMLMSAIFFLVGALAPQSATHVELNNKPIENMAPADRAQLDEALAKLTKEGGITGRFGRRLQALMQMDSQAIHKKVTDGMASKAPKAMFVLLPLFALLLKALYARRGRFYIEHFVFALQFHSFAFLVLLLPEFVRVTKWPVNLVLLLYLGLALHRVYAQSWPRTLWKLAALSAAYLVAIGVTVGAMAAATVFFD
jgi:hypothetical protein